MWKILLILGFVPILIILFKCGTYLYFLYLRMRLRDAGLEECKHALGHHFRFREIHKNAFRYKWKKGWMVIRASFDENGRLITDDMHEVGFNRITSQYSFSRN